MGILAFNCLVNNSSLYNEKSYSLVITDINMPIMNGDELTKKIREIEESNSKNVASHLPIIAYSGNSEKSEITELLKVGMDDYFIKGNNIEYLVDLIQFWTEF